MGCCLREIPDHRGKKTVIRRRYEAQIGFIVTLRLGADLLSTAESYGRASLARKAGGLFR